MTATKNAVFTKGFYLAERVMVSSGQPPKVLWEWRTERPPRRGMRVCTIKKLRVRTIEPLSLSVEEREWRRNGDGRAREIKKLEVYKNYIIKKAKIALTN